MNLGNNTIKHSSKMKTDTRIVNVTILILAEATKAIVYKFRVQIYHPIYIHIFIIILKYKQTQNHDSPTPASYMIYTIFINCWC
jgi:hypothetical protein